MSRSKRKCQDHPYSQSIFFGFKLREKVFDDAASIAVRRSIWFFRLFGLKRIHCNSPVIVAPSGFQVTIRLFPVLLLPAEPGFCMTLLFVQRFRRWAPWTVCVDRSLSLGAEYCSRCVLHWRICSIADFTAKPVVAAHCDRWLDSAQSEPLHQWPRLLQYKRESCWQCIFFQFGKLFYSFSCKNRVFPLLTLCGLVQFGLSPSTNPA